MKKTKVSQTKDYLIRLNLSDPDDRTVAEMLQHRRGMTVTKFFVNAVLADDQSVWREADRDFLRQTLREELHRLPVQTIAAAKNEIPEAEPAISVTTMDEVPDEAQDFMKMLGFDCEFTH